MFEFNVELNDEDYIQFNQYHMINSPMGKRNLMIYRAIIPIVCFFVISIFWMAGVDGLLIFFEFVPLTILSLLWVIGSKRIIIRSVKRNINRLKKEGRLPYEKQYVVKFQEEIIHEITSEEESKIKYSKVEKVIATENYVYVYLSSVHAIILPLKVFKDRIKMEEFLGFINNKCGKECPNLGICDFFIYANSDKEEESLNGFLKRYCLTDTQEKCIRKKLSIMFGRECVPSNMMPNGLPLPGTKKDGWDERAKNFRNYV